MRIVKRSGAFLASLLFLFAMSFMLLPASAHADFPERPAGFVVLDGSREMTGSMYSSWRQVVKWAYHFPYYKIVEDSTVQQETAAAFQGKVKEKEEKAVMAALAEKCGLDVLVLARIYELDEEYVHSLFADMETFIKVEVRADLLVYKKDGDKFLKKKLRERELCDPGNYEKPEDTVKWELCKLVNTMEGRPIIN